MRKRVKNFGVIFGNQSNLTRDICCSTLRTNYLIVKNFVSFPMLRSVESHKM